MPNYNKLVRDRIPDIIRSTGKECETRTLEKNDYINSLQTKLQEELNEYQNTDHDQDALEELADLLELIHVLSDVHGGSIEKLEDMRRQKAEQRGSFYEKVFLVNVDD
ncbi:nucleoside triphosphate pyrophosphohydrolase [Thalassobacillus sp. CUG 92003]|uniref:nucleoside triphosphate pyrophosphohydrolase n=1 Tax=Thalassobacillus sp. CUG 92003 TaxID=2736641 RepID=UPI0015E6F5F2|nr:nucleoside triphosphate pyrophosphohydrolase [Thalassobacillus sp. CUG 92003]